MSDVARLDRILAALPNPADRDWLSERLEPRWRRRERRLLARYKAVREIAAEFYSDCTSVRDIVQGMRADLRRMATLSGFDDPHRTALRRLLVLSKGRILGRTTLSNALAGIQQPGGQNSLADSGHATSYKDAMGNGDTASGKVEEVADCA
jgi:hypothetical protein